MAKSITEYTLPLSLRWDGGPSVIGLKLLNVKEELTASEIGRFNVQKTQYEAAKLSIAELDGAPVNNANGDVDVFWDKCGPKVRDLILKAHNEMSSPSAEEEKGFFGSAQQKVA